MKKFSKTIIIAFVISAILHFMLFFTLNETLKNPYLRMNTSDTKSTLQKKGLVNVKYVKIQPNIEQKETPQKPQQKTVPLQNPAKTEEIKKSVPLIELPKAQKEPLDLKKFFTIQKQQKTKQELEEETKRDQERKEEIQEIRQLSELTQSYIKLYGEQYFTFSENQKKYLKQNLNTIGRITQRYLRYPQISIRTKQQGTNVIEFYLHPNGDISELKLIDSSYYTALDDNTIKTIKIAYQDYPKPAEKVKIKIYVKYIMN